MLSLSKHGVGFFNGGWERGVSQSDSRTGWCERGGRGSCRASLRRPNGSPSHSIVAKALQPQRSTRAMWTSSHSAQQSAHRNSLSMPTPHENGVDGGGGIGSCVAP